MQNDSRRRVTWFLKKTTLLIFEFWTLEVAVNLAPKGDPLFNDAEFAITQKKTVTRVTWLVAWFLH